MYPYFPAVNDAQSRLLLINATIILFQQVCNIERKCGIIIKALRSVLQNSSLLLLIQIIAWQGPERNGRSQRR
jgi:hypothetical protein